VGDDAYITFRTVDNFVNGYGLTWNTDERVQTYTHPLWMFYLTAVYSFTHEIFFTSIIASIVVSVIALLFFSFKTSRTFPGAFIGLVLLLLSKAFVDYTSSGLENPLTYLILVLFFYVYFKYRPRPLVLFFLSLLACLNFLNRMDTILIYLPPLIFAYISSKKWFSGVLALCLGFIPAVAWLGFSLVYYGFIFPNTAYAKLNTGIEGTALIKQGISYLENSLKLDPVTIPIILTGIFGYSFTREKSTIPVSAGIILYILYTIKIGGDFMSGRFLTAPLLCAVIIISQTPYKNLKLIWAPCLCLALVLGLTNPYCPVYSDKSYVNKTIDEYGIADERGFYFPVCGMLNADKEDYIPKVGWADDGLMLRWYGPSIHVDGYMGLMGFCAGPEVHLVDFHALTDPLLARMHIPNPDFWRIGHFYRIVPAGYIETIINGKDCFADKNLGQYYEKLSIIIRGDIFDPERLKEIWNFNTGKYDYLLSKYNRSLVHLDSKKGVEIDLDKEYHAGEMEVSLDNNDSYNLYFMQNYCLQGKLILQANLIPGGGLCVYNITLPEEVSERGYNKICLVPIEGDGSYSIGHLKLIE
jgi:arabinofuranosyltransferase